MICFEGVRLKREMTGAIFKLKKIKDKSVVLESEEGRTQEWTNMGCLALFFEVTANNPKGTVPRALPVGIYEDDLANEVGPEVHGSPVEEENKSWLCIQFWEWAVLFTISDNTNAEHSYSL